MQTSESQCLTQRLDYSCSGTCADTPPACVACLPGSHKPDFSTAGNDETCVQCSVDEFQPFYQSIDCIPCPMHESHYYTNVSARETCKCDPGYFRRNTSLEPEFLDASLLFGLNPCDPCANGYFKSHQGDAECSKCHAGTYQPFLNATGCFFCANETATSTAFENALQREQLENFTAFVPHPVLQTRATAHEGTTTVLGCVCDLGFAPVDLEQIETVASVTFTQTCTACIPGTFKEHKDLKLCSYCGTYIDGHGGSYLHTFGDSAEYGATSIHHCQACPANSGQDHLLIGVDRLVMQDVDSCKCFMGFENRTDLRGCSNCTNYQIQPEYSDNACGFCPDGHYFVAAYLECTECYIADQKGHDPHVQLVLNSIDPALPWATSAADCM